jgi:hypothetical protein
MRWPGWHGGIRASPADNVHTKITTIYNTLVKKKTAPTDDVDVKKASKFHTAMQRGDVS